MSVVPVVIRLLNCKDFFHHFALKQNRKRVYIKGCVESRFSLQSQFSLQSRKS